MDKTNQKIVSILQRQGRISFADLARQVHLTPPAVAERVKRLEESGVITGYTASVDFHALGFPITAMVQLNVFMGKEPVVAKFISERPEVIEGFNVTGDKAYIIKVVTESMKALDGFLEELSNMAETNTMMVLSEVTRKPAPASS